MGTRRSRHNKGRKPVYKDYRSIASNLIANKGWSWAWTHTNWRPEDELKLSILCDADADVEASADVIGRTPTSIAHRARDTGLTLPRQWAQLIAPKRKKTRLVVDAGPMAYPYISKPTSDHADILAINAIVPAGMPDNVRADICQEIMIAILEGQTTIEKLRARKGTASYFIRRFYKENYEQAGNEISFSNLDDDRSYDEVAASIAAKEYRHEQISERHRHIEPMLRLPFTPPNQFEAAWNDQVGRFRLSRHQLGQFLSAEEAEELLEAA